MDQWGSEGSSPTLPLDATSATLGLRFGDQAIRKSLQSRLGASRILRFCSIALTDVRDGGNRTTPPNSVRTDRRCVQWESQSETAELPAEMVMDKPLSRGEPRKRNSSVCLICPSTSSKNRKSHKDEPFTPWNAQSRNPKPQTPNAQAISTGL